MADFTSRGIAKRKAAQKQMLTESANEILKERKEKEQAEFDAIRESREEHFQRTSLKAKQKRQSAKALKEYSETIKNCTRLVITEMVFQGIPASKEEKEPYRNSIMTELTEFFQSSVCNFDTKDNQIVALIAEEVGLQVSEGFDISGKNNDNFTEYAESLTQRLIEDDSSTVNQIIKKYAPVIEERTLSSILAAQQHSEKLSDILETKADELSESTVNDKRLTEVALQKVHKKVSPTLFESVFKFVKRRAQADESLQEVTNEMIMQEASCFMSMLEGANVVGVLPEMNMRSLATQLSERKVLEENVIKNWVEKVYTGYSKNEVEEITNLIKDIKDEEEAKKLYEKIDKAITDIEKDEERSDFSKYLSSGVIGVKLREKVKDDRKAALEYLKNTKQIIKKKFKL